MNWHVVIMICWFAGALLIIVGGAVALDTIQDDDGNWRIALAVFLIMVGIFVGALAFGRAERHQKVPQYCDKFPAITHVDPFTHKKVVEWKAAKFCYPLRSDI